MLGYDNYGIRRIIKQKDFANYRLLLAEIFGHDLYGVIVIDTQDNSIHFSQCYWVTDPKYYVNALHKYNEVREQLFEKDYSILY